MRKLLFLALVLISTAWAQQDAGCLEVASPAEELHVIGGSSFDLNLSSHLSIASLYLDLEYLNKQSKDFGLDLEGMGILVIRRDGKEVMRIYTSKTQTVVIDKGCTVEAELDNQFGKGLVLDCEVTR